MSPRPPQVDVGHSQAERTRKHGVSLSGPPKSRAGQRTMAALAWVCEMLAAHTRKKPQAGDLRRFRGRVGEI